MLGKEIIGNYVSVKSNIHSMNPIAKILCTILFVVMALFSFNIEVSIILVLLLLIIIMNTNIPLSKYYYIIKKTRYLLILVFLLFSLITFSLIDGLTVLIDIILIIMIIFILSMTTPSTELVYGLEKVLIPFNKINIKANKIALKIIAILGIIPIFIDASEKILVLQASRGIDYRLSFKDKITAYKNMIKPAIQRTKDIQKNLQKTMEIRLFSIEKNRTNYRINKWTFFDTYMLVIHIIFLTIIIIRGVI